MVRVDWKLFVVDPCEFLFVDAAIPSEDPGVFLPVLLCHAIDNIQESQHQVNPTVFDQVSSCKLKTDLTSHQNPQSQADSSSWGSFRSSSAPDPPEKLPKATARWARPARKAARPGPCCGTGPPGAWQATEAAGRRRPPPSRLGL